MYKIYARKTDSNQPSARGIPFGVIVVIPNSFGGVDIGWSQCSKNDRFDKSHGTRIAMSRLQNSPIKVRADREYFESQSSWSPIFMDTVRIAIEEVENNPQRYSGVS